MALPYKPLTFGDIIKFLVLLQRLRWTATRDGALNDSNADNFAFVERLAYDQFERCIREEAAKQETPQ